MKSKSYCITNMSWLSMAQNLISGMENHKAEPSGQAPTVSKSVSEPNVLSPFISIFTHLSPSLQIDVAVRT